MTSRQYITLAAGGTCQICHGALGAGSPAIVDQHLGIICNICAPSVDDAARVADCCGVRFLRPDEMQFYPND